MLPQPQAEFSSAASSHSQESVSGNFLHAPDTSPGGISTPGNSSMSPSPIPGSSTNHRGNLITYFGKEAKGSGRGKSEPYGKEKAQKDDSGLCCSNQVTHSPPRTLYTKHRYTPAAQYQNLIRKEQKGIPYSNQASLSLVLRNWIGNSICRFSHGDLVLQAFCAVWETGLRPLR